MNYLKEFVILVVCLFLGVITRHIIDFPIPEAVYGMIYLFIALNFKILTPDEIRATSDGILMNLSLLFVPVGVGIMTEYDTIRGKTLLIVCLIVVSTALTMGITGKVVELLQRRRKDVW